MIRTSTRATTTMKTITRGSPRDLLDRVREVEILLGDPALVVRAQRDVHRAPAHVEVGVMVGGLGEEADTHDERDRVGERLPLERLADDVAVAGPPGQAFEPARDLRVRELRHAPIVDPVGPPERTGAPLTSRTYVR